MKFIFGFFTGLVAGMFLALAPLATAIGVIVLMNQEDEEALTEEPTPNHEETPST